MRPSTILSALALLGATMLAASGQAQSTSKRGSTYKSFGNSYLGGVAHANATFTAERSSSGTRASGSAAFGAAGYVLDHFAQVVRFSASASSDSARTTRPESGLVRAYLGSLRVLDARYTGSGSFRPSPVYRTLDLFPTDVSVTVTIAGVPISVRGNVGIGFSASTTLGLARGYGSITASASGWGYGRVSAQAGIPGFNVGAQVVARFANQTVRAAAQADARYGATVSGTIDYLLRAIQLQLDVYVTVIRRVTRTLVNWSSAEVRIANLLTL
jgi:hypothetical protein